MHKFSGEIGDDGHELAQWWYAVAVHLWFGLDSLELYLGVSIRGSSEDVKGHSFPFVLKSVGA